MPLTEFDLVSANGVFHTYKLFSKETLIDFIQLLRNATLSHKLTSARLSVCRWPITSSTPPTRVKSTPTLSAGRRERTPARAGKSSTTKPSSTAFSTSCTNTLKVRLCSNWVAPVDGDAACTCDPVGASDWTLQPEEVLDVVCLCKCICFWSEGTFQHLHYVVTQFQTYF